jgi:uncharacterized protein
MSVFKEHKTIADRSSSDRKRHRDKIDRAIKEGIYDIVAEESIIGKDGKKKIKIPVRGIKEYKFVYGQNSGKSVGSAPGKNVKRGDKFANQNGKQKQKGNKPSEGTGEEFYEVEITLDELSEYLFHDLELPDLVKKSIKKIQSKKIKRKGYRNNGIRPRLDKKETVKRMLKRKKLSGKIEENDEEESFPFNEKDLKYRHFKPSITESSNAVIFFIMDISGSMGKPKKYLARSFFFLLYHFIRSRYENTELVFIAHDVDAYECNEEQFFQRGSSGGTLVSSAFNMLESIILERYHPQNWNIYAFQCSDGDNWPEDNEKVSKKSAQIKKYCQFFGYCEIEPYQSNLNLNLRDESTLWETLRCFADSKFKLAKVAEKQDVWEAFNHFFGGKLANV